MYHTVSTLAKPALVIFALALVGCGARESEAQKKRARIEAGTKEMLVSKMGIAIHTFKLDPRRSGKQWEGQVITPDFDQYEIVVLVEEPKLDVRAKKLAKLLPSVSVVERKFLVLIEEHLKEKVQALEVKLSDNNTSYQGTAELGNGDKMTLRAKWALPRTVAGGRLEGGGFEFEIGKPGQKNGQSYLVPPSELRAMEK